MEKKIITYNDFKEIAKNNEYFLWNFLQKEQEKNTLSIWSIFKQKKGFTNGLKILLDDLSISYYESYVDESIDFLINIGVENKIWAPPTKGQKRSPNYFYNPVILLFKGHSLKNTTFQSCYCIEGIVDLLGKENPELLSGLI
jgi:hypothetical protein